jgi:hypothetical protein
MKYLLILLACFTLPAAAGHPEGKAAILVDSAYESVYVTASELTPNWPLFEALLRARDRGVRVRVLLHQHRNNGAYELRAEGLAVYEIEDFRLSAKSPDDFVVVIDEETLVRGTQTTQDRVQASRLIRQFKELVLINSRFDRAMQR